MARSGFCATLLALLSATGALAAPVYLAPDVPTAETLTLSDLLPWTVTAYGGTAYSPVVSVPGSVALDGLQRRDGANDWLFSLEAPSDLAGMLPAPADPRDVVAYDGATGTYSVLLCGAAVGIPSYANVDAVVQDADDGPLLLGFDVPTTLGTTTYDPSDLVRFDRAGGGCGGWAVAPGAPPFDASAAGLPLSANVVGADSTSGGFVLAFDAPVTVASGTHAPGRLLLWNGTTWSPYLDLAGWPRASGVEALSLAGNPGTVPPTLQVSKAPGDQLALSWEASCAQDALDYAIYQGTIGAWSSHTAVDCTDDGGDRIETLSAPVSSSYFLVVALGADGEGSYGTATGGERPRGTSTCAPARIVSTCVP
jgi:hypothetical protein